MPSKLPTLYKFASDKKRINSWQIEIEKNCFRTITGFHGMKLTTSEWTCCGWKNAGKSNACNPEQQAQAEADALHRKRIEKGYVDDITKLSKKTKNFEPMLAKKIEDETVIYPVWSQPKLDGIRCIAKYDGLWTRNGKIILSAPHIFEALWPLFKKDPDLILDGELYADKLKNDFDTICSIVKKQKPSAADIIESAKSIQYHIYDLPSAEDETFSGRYELLSLLPLPECCILVKTDVVKSQQEMLAKYSEYIEDGYEGQMIRTGGLYENKRSKYLLKHKSFVDEEYTILDVFEGEGNRTGMVGYMSFENKDGKPFKSNVKASWPRLKEMWENRSNLIGKEATIKYFQLTVNGIPRFPYVVGIRDYE